MTFPRPLDAGAQAGFGLLAAIVITGVLMAIAAIEALAVLWKRLR